MSGLTLRDELFFLYSNNDTMIGRQLWQRSYAFFTMIRWTAIRNPILGTIFPKSTAIRMVRLFRHQNRSILSQAPFLAACLANWACANTSNPRATNWL